MTAELSWYALRTLPQREPMVKKLLVWRGLKAFVKTEARARRKTKHDQKREARRFTAAPGYVFVGLDEAAPNPWMLVHNCHMIRSVVSLDGRPVRLHAETLADFLGFEDFDMPEHLMWFRTSQEMFSIGDMVRIDSPSFEGFTLPVKNIDRGEAIFDLVMMGRATELRIPLRDCYKAA
jgi:transcription antitermination factor NusG